MLNPNISLTQLMDDAAELRRIKRAQVRYNAHLDHHGIKPSGDDFNCLSDIISGAIFDVVFPHIIPSAGG